MKLQLYNLLMSYKISDMSHEISSKSPKCLLILSEWRSLYKMRDNLSILCEVGTSRICTRTAGLHVQEPGAITPMVLQKGDVSQIPNLPNELSLLYVPMQLTRLVAVVGDVMVREIFH